MIRNIFIRGPLRPRAATQQANQQPQNSGRRFLRRALSHSHWRSLPEAREVRRGGQQLFRTQTRLQRVPPPPEKGAGSLSQAQEGFLNNRPLADSAVVMATEVLTTLAFPQPCIDPVLEINITMKQYLHLIHFNWLLHNNRVSELLRAGPLKQQDGS